MSTWIEVEQADIDIDFKAKDIDIFIDADEFGRNYVTLTFEQIERLYNEIQMAKE